MDSMLWCESRRALGQGGGTGGVEEQGDLLAVPLLNEFFEKRRLFLLELAAELLGPP